MKTAFAALAISAGFAGVINAAGASDIRVGYTADPLTLDPANHSARQTEVVIKGMYDALVTRDRQMNIQPELAESYKEIDPTTWEFKIRKGVKFHDGTPMTAADVKFTFDRVINAGAVDGQSSPRKVLLGPVKEVQLIDDSTVRFILSAPWPILPAMLPYQEIVSRAFVEKSGKGGLATAEDGTGAFQLVEWRKGDAVILKRFDEYYGGSPAVPPVGKACADHAIFKIIPENASRVAALLSGDVDIITDLPVHDIKQVEANPATRVMSVNSTRTFFVAINLTKKPLQDLRVRQALNHAIDKKLIIDRILGGKATALNGVLSPDAFSFDSTLKAYDYNPALAKQLLIDAGYKNGIDLTMDTRAEFKEIAEAIAATASKAGIRLTVSVGEASELTAKWNPTALKGDDLYFTSWGNGTLDPYDIMNPVLMTKGSGNTAGYSNPKVDALLSEAEIEQDRGKRAALYKQVQQIVNADAPWVFLWLPQDIYGVSKKVSQWAPSSDGFVYLQDACVAGK